MIKFIMRNIINVGYIIINVCRTIYLQLKAIYYEAFYKKYDISGKNAVVTGVTVPYSIGYETAKILLDNDVNIIITGRTQKGLDICRNKLLEHRPDLKVYTKILYLEDQKSIEE